jgi:formylglycine-generating enzyme required for sulfatase activity
MEFLGKRSVLDYYDCDVIVVIPLGGIRMGILNGVGGKDEKPAHDVLIGYSIAVGKYEVTFLKWDPCVSDGDCGGYRPDDKKWGRGQQPVINVNWDDARGIFRG